MLPIRSKLFPEKPYFLFRTVGTYHFRHGSLKKWYDLFSGYKDRLFEGA